MFSYLLGKSHPLYSFLNFIFKYVIFILLDEIPFHVQTDILILSRGSRQQLTLPISTQHKGEH